jgi:hypothetical protein
METSLTGEGNVRIERIGQMAESAVERERPWM